MSETEATLIMDAMKTIYRMEDDISRKNRLLKEALFQLKALEWDVSIGLIADIEKELGTDADK